jgi:hypothetical protein
VKEGVGWLQCTPIGAGEVVGFSGGTGVGWGVGQKKKMNRWGPPISGGEGRDGNAFTWGTFARGRRKGRAA